MNVFFSVAVICIERKNNLVLDTIFNVKKKKKLIERFFSKRLFLFVSLKLFNTKVAKKDRGDLFLTKFRKEILAI